MNNYEQGEKSKVTGRMTRLGDFSPMGRLITLGGFMKMIEVSQFFVLLFPTENYDKAWVG
jgi:hypothetical protein